VCIWWSDDLLLFVVGRRSLFVFKIADKHTLEYEVKADPLYKFTKSQVQIYFNDDDHHPFHISRKRLNAKEVDLGFGLLALSPYL